MAKGGWIQRGAIGELTVVEGLKKQRGRGRWRREGGEEKEGSLGFGGGLKGKERE
jgi:hypothetical protein